MKTGSLIWHQQVDHVKSVGDTGGGTVNVTVRNVSKDSRSEQKLSGWIGGALMRTNKTDVVTRSAVGRKLTFSESDQRTETIRAMSFNDASLDRRMGGDTEAIGDKLRRSRVP
jgi:hypothetical protein